MAWKPRMTLDELNTEMTALFAKMKDVEENGGLTKDEMKQFKTEVVLVVESLQEHGEWTMVFKPEVPTETRKMYVELEEFACWG